MTAPGAGSPGATLHVESDGRPAAARSPWQRWFASVALLLDFDMERGDFRAPADRLCTWLAELDAWFKSSVGVAEGEGLHLLYHRRVSAELVSGGLSTALLGRLVQIAETCSRLRLQMSLAVDAAELHAHAPVFHETLARAGLRHLDLHVDGTWSLGGPTLMELVADVMERGLGAQIIGSPGQMAALGVFDDERYNRANMFFVPNSPAPPPALRHLVMPCARRFELVVAPDGRIYPCRGLLGAPVGTSVLEPASDRMAGFDVLDIGALAQHGPDLSGMDKPYPRSHAELCEGHRRQIEGGAYNAASGSARRRYLPVAGTTQESASPTGQERERKMA